MNVIKHRLFMIGLYTLCIIASTLWIVGAAIQTVGDYVFNFGDVIRDLAQAIVNERKSRF